MKKLLYSPGYGAGWTTWADDKHKQFMVSHPAIVEFIEGGGTFTHAECAIGYSEGQPDLSNLHPVLRIFAEECLARFGSIPYLGGAVGLKVLEVPNGMSIAFDEYDGGESPRYRDDGDWY